MNTDETHLLSPEASTIGHASVEDTRAFSASDTTLDWASKPESQSYCKSRRESRTKAWALFVLPLAAHFLLVIAITIFMLVYVDGGQFNLNSRRPSITQVDGSVTLFDHYSPLQTDVTTTLSLALVLTRLAAAAWCGATTWRCAFLLMRRTGLSLHELNTMITFGVLAKFKSDNGEYGIAIIATILLLAVLPSQLSAPILTGSTTWSPSLRHTRGLHPIAGISTPENGDPWSWYQRFPSQRSGLVMQAAGLAAIAWEQSDDTTTLKRVIPASRSLPINTTLANVTLPYFTVGAIDWITDPNITLTPQQMHAIDANSPYLNISSLGNPLHVLAPTVALIPNTSWTSMAFRSSAVVNTSSSAPPLARQLSPSPDDGSSNYVNPYTEQTASDWLNSFGDSPYTNATPVHVDFPPPSMVSQVGILAALASIQNISVPCGWNTSTFFGSVARNTGFVSAQVEIEGQRICYCFARVTYSAGAGICHNCRLSSPTVVQNETALTLQADVMTAEALAMMPEVIEAMVFMNTSIPLPVNNLNNYTIALLSRSYAAAWTALTNFVGSVSTPLDSEVDIPVPISQAHVAYWRVYVWLGLNLLVTLSGILFTTLLMRCGEMIVLDTAVAALLLDSHHVLHDNEEQGLCNFSMLVKEDKVIGPLRLKKQGGHDILVPSKNRLGYLKPV
jgi:hypothetical protein